MGSRAGAGGKLTEDGEVGGLEFSAVVFVEGFDVAVLHGAC